jgi:hypothetical protein
VRRELAFLPEVSEDFVEGFSFYENLSPGRGGSRFETAFKLALQAVESGLITHARVFEHYHRVLLPRFPYTLYYRIVKDRAVIAAVLYSRFDPKRIEATLKQRME